MRGNNISNSTKKRKVSSAASARSVPAEAGTAVNTSTNAPSTSSANNAAGFNQLSLLAHTAVVLDASEALHQKGNPEAVAAAAKKRQVAARGVTAGQQISVPSLPVPAVTPAGSLPLLPPRTAVITLPIPLPPLPPPTKKLKRALSERDKFLIFCKILFKGLDDAQNPPLRNRARLVVGQCLKQHRIGNAEYMPLQPAVERRLLPIVGQTIWERTLLLLQRYIEKEHHQQMT